MATKKGEIRDHLIEPEHAARHAAAHMHTGIFTNTPGMTSWHGANLGELTTIYDFNGQPLFYDFPVLSPQSKQVGTIRASASRVLGVQAPTTYLGGPHWNIGTATLWAHKYVESKLKGRIIDSRPVCYGYPKVGIAVNWEDTTGQAQRSLIDVGDYSVIQEKQEPGMNGSSTRSFYDNIPEKLVSEGIEQFALYDKLVEELQKRAGVNLAAPFDLDQFHRVQSSLAEMISFFRSKTLTLCDQGFSNDCFRLYGQEKVGYCTPATGQMLLDYWGYDKSQVDIAGAMGTHLGVTLCGTSELMTDYAGEKNGLESLTNNQLEAEIDNSPTFNKAKAEIKADRPFDYAYSVHSTACVGYRQALFHMLGTMPEVSVYLYDPWPVNKGGAIRWESWGSSWLWICNGANLQSPLFAFVYLRRP